MGYDQNNPIDFVRAAVDDQLAIGFTATCEVRNGEIVVTLRRGQNTHSFALPADFQEADSDALAEALKMPMEKARRALLALEVKKPKRKAPLRMTQKAGTRAKKKAKRAKKTPALSASSIATPGAADPVGEASTAPASTTIQENTDVTEAE